MLKQATISLCCIAAATAATAEQGDPRTSTYDLFRAVSARASTTSEVLTLNLTNLIILVVIKAIILGFGLFGAGGIGRRSDSTLLSHVREILPDMKDASMVMAMSLAEKTNEYGCFYRIACEEPDRAHDYITGGKMVLKGVKTFKRFLPVDDKYDDIVRGLEEAVEVNDIGQNCKETYTCPALD